MPGFPPSVLTLLSTWIERGPFSSPVLGSWLTCLWQGCVWRGQPHLLGKMEAPRHRPPRRPPGFLPQDLLRAPDLIPGT